MKLPSLHDCLLQIRERVQPYLRPGSEHGRLRRDLLDHMIEQTKE